MIQTIFFDFDGVLTQENSGFDTIVRNLCRDDTRLEYTKTNRCFRIHFTQLLTKKGSHRDGWEDFCSCLGREISYRLFLEALSTVTENTEMLNIARALREHYTIGLLTDNSEERINFIDEKMQLSSIFHLLIVSGIVGAAKFEQTEIIFQHAIEAAGCAPEELLFIDNRQKNLFVPRSMGIQTYWHDDAKNDVRALKKALKEWGIRMDDI